MASPEFTVTTRLPPDAYFLHFPDHRLQLILVATDWTMPMPEFHTVTIVTRRRLYLVSHLIFNI